MLLIFINNLLAKIMKRKFVLLVAASASLFAFKPFIQSTWTADPAHSRIGFSITHMMISDVEGSFRNFESTVSSTKADFSDAVINLSAEVKSVNTENEKRDAHLINADFFDAEKFPKLTFKSTAVNKISENKLLVKGLLTFHGITKPVQLNATLRGLNNNPKTGKSVAGFKVTGTIKRSDFNFGTKYPGAVLSDEVELNANTEFKN